MREHICQDIKTSQHGFIREKSCVTNLLEVLNYIGSVLETGSQIDSVYLDMSKAFDKVNHELLLHKLQLSGIGGNVLEWFRSYLILIVCCVLPFMILHIPIYIAVRSGVPQGSILGPVLFSLYVNDLPDAVTSSHDTKLFKDCTQLQNDLGQLQTWSENSGLKFNTSKCKSETIASKLKS